MVIAHPVCTFMCNSGALRLYINGKKENGICPIRWKKMVESAKQFKRLLELPCDKIVIENPVMHKHAMDIIGVKQSQSIQPYEFNEDASKRTCLWIKGLPLLKKTGYYPSRIIDGKKRWSNQTDSGQNKLPPSETRGKERSKTYGNIAKAMADQWSSQNPGNTLF